jgi:plasmid stability protein
MPGPAPADRDTVPVQRTKIHVNLPNDVLLGLRRLAAAEGESWPAVMRRILRQGLDREGRRP